MRIRLTFTWKMFILYSLLFSTLIAGIALTVYFYISSTLMSSKEKEMEQTVRAISVQTDAIMDRMNSLSQLFLFNQEVQDALIETLSHQESPDNYFNLNIEKRAQLKNTMLSIIGIQDIPRRVALYNGRQTFVNYSITPKTDGLWPDDLRKLPWIEEMNKRSANELFLPPHEDLWSTEQKPVNVISFVRRLLYLKGGTAIGFLEIQQPASILDRIIDETLPRTSSLTIRDAAGQLIYPYQPEARVTAAARPDITTPPIRTIEDSATGEQQILYHYISPHTNWSFTQTISRDELIKPVKHIQQIIISAGILMILLTLVFIYFISNSLTAPIRAFRKSLDSVSMQAPALDFRAQGSQNEIILLNRAFNKAVQKLQESMNQTIEARSRELEAHVEALQSQMDPHFLFNSLMAISSVGQEEKAPLVVEMCDRLSQMLRYTASHKDATVVLADELKHAEHYIRMMKLRYEDYIEVKFDIDESLSDIRVPKLIVQPLIENAFSHGFADSVPPYRISVTGRRMENSWTLKIKDNGCGFTEETLRSIRERLQEYDASLLNHDFRSKLEIGGMTIGNVYVRLRILYNKEALFDIANNHDGGATVTIGGSLAKAEKGE